MKYVLLLATVPLAGCEAFSQAASDPVVVEHFQQAGEALASGDMSKAMFATISGAIALVGGGVAKWVHGRMKTSKTGEILGGAPTQPG